MYLVVGDGRIEDRENGCTISGAVYADPHQARQVSLSIGDGANVYELRFKGSAIEINRTEYRDAKDLPRKTFPKPTEEQVAIYDDYLDDQVIAVDIEAMELDIFLPK